MIVAIAIVAALLVVGIVALVIARRRRARSLAPASDQPPLPQVLVTEVVERPTLDEAPSLGTRIGATRGVFERIRSMSATGALGVDELAIVEEVLLRSDVGVATTASILDGLRRDGAGDGVAPTLRRALRACLVDERSVRDRAEPGRVAVWLFVGVNGVGKTTTIGKLAHREIAAGRSVVLAAGDTFRAAAAEQLGQWAERSGAELVRVGEGADPGAVIHDAIGRAAARGADLVLADTAGRRSNSTNLLEELAKVRRVADRGPGQVVETFMVLDATTGQNALSQAREFLAAAAVSGIVLTKLDGTARGGIVVAIERELGIPVKFVGVGEGVADLIPFDPDEFVDSLIRA